MKHTFSCLAAMILVSLAGMSAAAAPKPNIVFILADDLGYGDVGTFNPDSKIRTPYIDGLAAEGLRFTDAHAGGSICVPSRYALLTGRFSARAELDWRSGPVIETGRITIAALLRQNAYQTAMVGKWHQGFEMLPVQGRSLAGFDYSKPLRGGPIDRGFDSFFGMHASLDIPPFFYIRGRSPIRPPTETVAASTSVGGEEGWSRIQGAFWREGAIAPDFKHAEVTPRFAAEAIKLIQSYGAGKKEKPLFLYLALPSPHTPWLPLKQFRGNSGAGMYGDFVMQVDAVVGQVLAALDDAGMAEDTLLVFTSDNGPVWDEKDVARFEHRSVGPLRGKKGSSWEGGHRMPFIVRWPGRIPAGSISEQTIAFSDVFATFSELIGLKQIPEGMAEDSVSFLPYLLDPDKPAKRSAPIVHKAGTLRDGDWKLILPRGKRFRPGKTVNTRVGELYNLRTDLAEEHNLIEEKPELASRMQAKLKAILAQ